MFRIRQLTDPDHPADRRELDEVVRLLREGLPGLSEDEIVSLPEKLRDPMLHRFRALVFVADDLRGHLKGFALLSHAPDVGFCLLDYIATGAKLRGHGTGGALYERVRTAARGLGARALVFECLPDDPAACSDPAYAKQNAARLRFYETFGARPMIGTGYETPLRDGDKDMPHLVIDDLDRGEPLGRDFVREVVRAVLERKYSELCPPEYVERVVASIVDDPVRLRPPRKAAGAGAKAPAQVAKDAPPTRPLESLVALVVNEGHDIHHVRERGYVEAPVRIAAILGGLLPTGLFHRVAPEHFARSHVLAVHDADYVDYFERVCRTLPEGRSVYPYVFPIRNVARPPKELAVRAGYYCIDTFTPLNRNAWLAALGAVDCALTAARIVLDGHGTAYALVRPPGHHAESRSFGGFCYFSNAAVAAQHLSRHGRVAMLDLDYHHGNGQEEIFWRRDDVLTVSIHGHPSFAYPYFSGFAEDVGADAGEGNNLNLPLPEAVDGDRYRRALEQALRRILDFGPRFLVVCLGLDTAKGDPTGSWSLGAADFERNGRAVGELGLPTVVVQEGGYRTRSLGRNARAFFEGLAAGRERAR
ncbi:MAG: histone deacetylase family protein [Planctomycetes bacterium]|nr:histone deacetylase family protein [Planctomycetota bacterium]